MDKLEIKKCVLEIIDSLCERRGFQKWWMDLHEDVDQAITKELEEIIQRRLDKNKDKDE
jgi:hypothetical protein